MDRQISPTSSAALVDDATCHVAIELSRKSWVVGVHVPLADKVGLHKLEAGDHERLVSLLSRLRDKSEQRLGRAVRMVSCYEAGYDGFWLHRVLVGHGIDSRVIDPASLQVNRRARRAKTDRLDATAMVRALMAHDRGEHQVFSLVRVPEVDEEDAKRMHRERLRLIRERVGHSNRIKGLLALHGIYTFNPLRPDHSPPLEELRTGDGRLLPARLRAEIGRQLKRLALVREMIGEVEAERNAIVATPAPFSAEERKIQDLYRLKAVGPEIATRLVREVFYRSFANRRHLGGYVGLGPSPFNSGKMVREQGISKAGNPLARTTMIELAWLWLRHQPESALSRWYRERTGEAKGRLRRIMIVALARKLLVALWRYTETGLIPDGAVFKA
jgi:transposase